MRVCLKIEFLGPSVRGSFTSNTRRELVARRYFKILTPSEWKRQTEKERERERETSISKGDDRTKGSVEFPCGREKRSPGK